MIGVSRTSFYRWRQKCNENYQISSQHEKSSYIKIYERVEVKELVFKVFHSPPSQYGFNRTTWRMDDLQQAIEREGSSVGKHAIRKVIKGAGFRWLKAKKVLTSKDPEYRVKLNNIQAILGGLKKNEGFFSIDEYGPFAVKQKPGKKLVGPGELFTVPQWQKSKGKLIMTAALELSTNQVTHFYSEKKDTEEMIKLLDILLSEYTHYDRIFLSWDAASWHISKKLFEKIESNNVMANITGSTRVEVAPLPAGAQFLNVIEAIFSGMSRAIIHNSNYQSIKEAKAAIDRYFEERNQYFLDNPKKAGKKIWGQEPSSTQFNESQNCKDPRYR
ncbi:MAG: IS630 family transposase [Rhodospirillaceae bacterium]|nr:IS630 family transposase [Rhodospirillaceae bacterium]MBT6402999.1 IS630 family transposase [Rhodospirillaceae bacterium]MBT6534787.1 IS630 family transposase [Rhodospirillaceae bacterium]MBT7488099.1 IS630 family transposase [Rhodospirillales bacterium]